MGKAETGSNNHLTLWIVAAVVAAVGLAWFFPYLAARLEPGGEIFLRLLNMLVVPLVMVSVMSGILRVGDVRRLGFPGVVTVAFYLATTTFAVATGLILVNLIRPGVGTIETEVLESLASGGPPSGMEGDARLGTILHNLLLMLFTDNLFAAAAEGKLLPLILFSLVFAAILTVMGEQASAVRDLVIQLNESFLFFILLLMKLAPLGIFCLIAARFGQAQAEGSFLEVLGQTGWYFVTVVVGLLLHGLVTLPLIMWVFTRRSPIRFITQMSQALLTAFSTASSTATLPVTMECAVDKARVSRRSADLVLPLGATINMDGTALYEAVAAIFIAQALGFPLSLTGQLTVAITATLAAIGAAGIPEAGLVTMVIVLNAVGLPVQYIGLVLSVDWLVDRFRTAVNIFGDSVGSTVVEKSFARTVDSSS